MRDLELNDATVGDSKEKVKMGDRVKVKLIERDERGRLRLSRKALLPKPEGTAESEPVPSGSDGAGSGASSGGGEGSKGEGEPRDRGRGRARRGGERSR